jgi:hypothetical protein
MAPRKPSVVLCVQAAVLKIRDSSTGLPAQKRVHWKRGIHEVRSGLAACWPYLNALVPVSKLFFVIKQAARAGVHCLSSYESCSKICSSLCVPPGKASMI